MSSLYWNHKEMKEILRLYDKVVMVDAKIARGLNREYYECYLHVDRPVRISKEIVYERPTGVVYNLRIRCTEEPP